MHSLSEIRNVLEFQYWSQVSHFIAKGLVCIGHGNPDVFLTCYISRRILLQKISVWNMFLQNGICAFPGSLYIDFIGHVI